MLERPKTVGHAVARGGTILTLMEDPECGIIAFDDQGCGPYEHVSGCPNCGKHAGEWWDPMLYIGSLNSGSDPNEPCSRACRYQLEWQAELAARKLTA